MMTATSGPGYSYIPAVGQYSAGVAASKTHELRREELPIVATVPEGFTLIAELLCSRKLLPSAVCALELRTPAAMTQDDFEALNQTYRLELARLDLLIGDKSPIARTCAR